MMRALRAAMDAAAAVLERRAAEVRFGTDLMRVVHTDNVVSQLRALTGSDEAALEVADIALSLLRVGAEPHEAEELLHDVQVARRMREFRVTVADVAIAAQERRRRERSS